MVAQTLLLSCVELVSIATLILPGALGNLRGSPSNDVASIADCPACVNFVGVLDGGGNSRPDGKIAEKLTELVTQQFGPDLQTVSLLCYDGAHRKHSKYCDDDYWSVLRAQVNKHGYDFKILNYQLTDNPSTFIEHLREAHILSFTPGNTLMEMNNLRRQTMANGKSLVDQLQDEFRAASRTFTLPVVFGSSAGAIVWFDGGISDSCNGKPWKADGEWRMARVQGMGILPGFVCAHADKDSPKRRDLWANIRQLERSHYTAVESGLQMNSEEDAGTIWIKDGKVHYLQGSVKSFVGGSFDGLDLNSIGPTSVSDYMYNQNSDMASEPRDLPHPVLRLEDVPRDFSLSNIGQFCFKEATSDWKTLGVDPHAYIANQHLYLVRYFMSSQGLMTDSQCIDWVGSGRNYPEPNIFSTHIGALLWSCSHAAQWEWSPVQAPSGESGSFGLIKWRNPNLDVGSESMNCADQDKFCKDWCLDVHKASWNSHGNGAEVILYNCGSNVARWQLDQKNSRIMFRPDMIDTSYTHRSDYCLDFKGSKDAQNREIGKDGSRLQTWNCDSTFLFVNLDFFTVQATPATAVIAGPTPAPPP